ncbi:Clp1-domain-containing protein [Sistotremastrum niveocremeum HHB9708]|uniref:Polynucleotide 5'-hydroxyl-kinase GRC3 n=1 Tax=Sistotremastrum niveocremeum HHB9708 TaxID=1314777 RepID=A0A164P5B2_9AGAM|nr:Clp1-domain-containing protein [Sistotremastrum niveocremeum HHB9708]
MSEEGSTESQSKTWNLAPNTEYRFELDPGTSLAIKLASGTAEVFGSELAEGKIYTFASECKAAIFTWNGCTIEVIGSPSTEYVSDETPMFAFANLALIFEQMRIQAWLEQQDPKPDLPPSGIENLPPGPPRVLVLGPENYGKTTACKILTNYAVRTEAGWNPMLVNLDTSEGGWTVPGTISACPVDTPIPTYSPANPLGSSATSAPTALSSSALLPLVYWYGHPDPRKKVVLMERLIRNLGESIDQRFESDPKCRASGLFIDTSSGFSLSSAGEKHRLVKACIDAFHVNVIVVIGHEKLNMEMQKLPAVEQSNILVLKIPKSGGVVEIDQAYRDRIIDYQLRFYFYGSNLVLPPTVSASSLGGEALVDLSLAPHSLVISFDDITIYRIGEETMAPSSALPIGSQRTITETQPTLIDPGQPGSGLLNAVLALLAFPAEGAEHYDEEVLDRDVSGFIVITELDIPNRKLTILAPSPGTLTARTALVGSFEWRE